MPSKKAPRTEHLSQEQKLALPADLIQAMAQAKLERSQFPPPPAPDPKALAAFDWPAFLKAEGRSRQLELLAKSSLGELPYVEEVLARLGQDYDEVDLKIALSEMFRRGWYRHWGLEADKAFAGLPADAPLSQLLNRLGIPMREDRSIHCPAAVTRIRRALRDGTFPSQRKFAEFSGIQESTLRKVLRNERADLKTWQGIAEAMEMPIKILLSDLSAPKNTRS